MPRGGGGIAPHLPRIFGGEASTIAVDLPEVVEWLTGAGVPAIPLVEVMSVDAGGVVAINANPETIWFAQKPQPGVRKIHLVQSVHGGDEHTVRYTIAQWLAADPWSCAQQLGDVAAEIKSSGGRFALIGAGTELTIQSRGRVGLVYLDDPLVKPGECLSGPAFFELGLGNLKPGGDGVFLVNGYCRAGGMIAGRGPELSMEPEPQEWVQYRHRIAQTGVELHIRDNQLLACLLDGRDIKADIAKWTWGYGLRITECSIGTNAQVLTGVDWSLNSLMNEGAQGMHLGFGLPDDGIHFDFICPGVALVAG